MSNPAKEDFKKRRLVIPSPIVGKTLESVIKEIKTKYLESRTFCLRRLIRLG